MKTTLETLWQPLCEGQALGLHLEAEAEKEEEEVVVEGEEVVEGGNQLLSLHNSLSLSHQPPIYESWKHFPKSSKEKEIRLMPL